MLRRTIISVFVVLVLAVSLAGTPTLGSLALNPGGASHVSAATFESSDDAAQTSKKRGNGFVRVVTAPFRALGKLFGGGRKRKTSEGFAARKVEAGAGAEQRQPTAVLPPAKQSEDLREKTENTLDAAKPVAPAPDAASTLVASKPSTAKEALMEKPQQPREWKPFIEGVPSDHLSQGRALLYYGYLNEAIAELSVAATVGPDLVEANNLLGQAYDRTGQHRQAREYYERALSLAPYNSSVLHNLGYSLYLADDYGGALKRLKQAARAAPNDTRIAESIALVQYQRRNYEEAFKSFARVEGEFHARVKLAQMLTFDRLDKEAIKQYEAALRLQPASPVVLEQLAELYLRTGRTKDAESARRTLGKPKQKTHSGGG
ncbi:MAG TPA: tetratricopeptide repeat protein [Pyrinomonadaceae bacterium]|jgi:tetratricopeptide (TPR) repeat protein